jgi:hypothetical protein
MTKATRSAELRALLRVIPLTILAMVLFAGAWGAVDRQRCMRYAKTEAREVRYGPHGCQVQGEDGKWRGVVVR